MGGDHSLLDEGNKKMINVPIKIETQLDNNLESNSSISSPRSGKESYRKILSNTFGDFYFKENFIPKRL